MAQLNPESLFQSWIISPEEFVQGTLLSGVQKQVIQNQICVLASEKCLLQFDPAHPNQFIQREAELQGSIKSLQYLIQLSSEAETQFDPGAQMIVIQTPLDH